MPNISEPHRCCSVPAVKIWASSSYRGRVCLRVPDAPELDRVFLAGSALRYPLHSQGMSTAEDREALKEAFAKDHSQGMADALSKMKGVGRVQIPGTVGCELALRPPDSQTNGPKNPLCYQSQDRIWRSIPEHSKPGPQPDGRRIDLNDKDKNKSAGILFPAAQHIVKQGRGTSIRTA